MQCWWLKGKLKETVRPSWTHSKFFRGHQEWDHGIHKDDVADDTSSSMTTNVVSHRSCIKSVTSNDNV
jgi:hypothetical protein